MNNRFIPFLLLGAFLFTLFIFSGCKKNSVNEPYKDGKVNEITFQKGSIKITIPLPFEITKEVVDGYENNAGWYENDDMIINFTFGFYAKNLEEYEGEPEFNMEQMTIDTLNAKYVSCLDNDIQNNKKFVAALFIPNIDESYKFSVVTKSKSRDLRATAKNIILGVKIEQ